MMRHETLSERTKPSDPYTDPRTPRSSVLARPLGAHSAPSGVDECPHCRTTLKHGERIGCCSGCKQVFTSTSAHEAHCSPAGCVDPITVGLEQKTLQGYVAYGWPRGNVVWDTTRQER